MSVKFKDTFSAQVIKGLLFALASVFHKWGVVKSS